MSTYTLARNTQTRANGYRFTIQTLNDPSLAALKESIRLQNQDIKRRNEYFTNKTNLLRVCVRPRGPRPNGTNQNHTLMANATHYDVYVHNRYLK